MVEMRQVGTMARAKMYGLALCFLMLVFFSSVKLSVYHSGDRDFASAKLWQQDTSGNQTVQVEDQQQATIAVLSLLLLLVVPALALTWISRSNFAPLPSGWQWLCPALFLRPPPVA
jgi:sterol desaturase/sphingolipid hydroxylase (fatty acid hydroxylase superfamily)